MKVLKSRVDSYNRRDMTGQTFGRLTAICATEKRKNRSVIWFCRCSCGNTIEVAQCDLVDGKNSSCGCLMREVAGNLTSFRHHIDGTCIELLEKNTIRSDNKTGYTGVSRRGTKYRAYISFKGRRYDLGTFETLKEAACVREQAREKLHGRFLEEYYRTQAASLSDGTVVPVLDQLLKRFIVQQG